MKKMFTYSIAAVLVAILFTSCAFKNINRSKNITYLAADDVGNKPAEKLNVFAPKKSAQLKEVLIFIHGGSWNSGRKEIYNFFGSRWARKDVVTVIVDYPKSCRQRVAQSGARWHRRSVCRRVWLFCIGGSEWQ